MRIADQKGLADALDVVFTIIGAAIFFTVVGLLAPLAGDQGATPDPGPVYPSGAGSPSASSPMLFALGSSGTLQNFLGVIAFISF